MARMAYISNRLYKELGKMDTVTSSVNQAVGFSGDVNHVGSVLAQPLRSAVIGKLEGYDHDAVGAGHTVQVMKARGANARLPHSMAVAVPEFTAADVMRAITSYPVLVDEFIAALYDAQREIIISLAATGTRTLQYSDITLDKVAASIIPKVRTAKLSKDAIVSWYNVAAADVMAVSIAGRLGLSSQPTDADMVRIQQVSNQVRDNLALLAAPAHKYDTRVRDSLNWALDSIIAAGLDDSGMSTRLKVRLNPAESAAKVDLADLLGM